MGVLPGRQKYGDGDEAPHLLTVVVADRAPSPGNLLPATYPGGYMLAA